MSDFEIILPEILLAIIALSMQIVAVYNKEKTRQIINVTMVLAVALCVKLTQFDEEASTGFIDSFEVSESISTIKALVLILSIAAIMIYNQLCRDKTLSKLDQKNVQADEAKMEFATLILLSTLGTFIIISARDLLLLFCGLELQALSSYALAAFNNKSVKSSEAGLKYFILSGLMSAIMLLGMSFLYGYSGSLNFQHIAIAIDSGYAIGLIVGAILLVSVILFKLSAAPLHFWAPDVYEGSPIAATAFFGAAQKIGVVVVLVNLVDIVFVDLPTITMVIIKYVAIFSLIAGALGALMQQKLKRLLAYSSVLNIGFVLIGISLNSKSGQYAAYLYFIIYAVTLVGLFASVVGAFGSKADYLDIDQLKGLAARSKIYAINITILIFSMIGLPPFAGFFGKFIIFMCAVSSSNIEIVAIGLIFSVIAAFYYLRIIKNIYFEPPQLNNGLAVHKSKSLLTLSCSITAFVALFFIFAPIYI